LKDKIYDFVVVGAGIAGTCITYFLSQKTNSILLIDKLQTSGQGASGAAGAFLSPLLGKPNKFKDLVNEALIFSTNFYKTNFPELIVNNGVLRIPKNEIDRDKFLDYEKDFEYSLKEDGYFFDIGSLVFSKELCQALSQKSEKLFDYEVSDIEQIDDIWIINKSIRTKNLILSTGANISLLPEKYIKIRPVWGQRIIVETSTKLTHNYHKECSVSLSFSSASNLCDQCLLRADCAIDTRTNDKYIVSIGATHHRFIYEQNISDEDTNKLLELSKDIVPLDDVRVIGAVGGARSSSEDYFPILGEIIDSKATLNEFPYIIHGTKIQTERLHKHKNMYVINGVGGRGFVLAPFLAKLLCDYIFDDKVLQKELTSERFFLRKARVINNKGVSV